MEHVYCSGKNECLLIDPNMENIHEIMNSNHEEDPPLFLDFPSPFFDGLSTTPTHTNNYTHEYHLSSRNNHINITDQPLPSESKRLKKRSGCKKDRHSKIHTAQGLRDRRMRLSLQIARKFFDLQDLLGFDKASKTIEWLFCKSNEAIKEVAKSFSPQHTNESMSEESCEVGLTSHEIKAATENSKEEEEMIKNTKPRKQIQNNLCVRETRDQARARARDRTRERLMIKELERSKQIMFGENPKEENFKLGLGYLASPNAEELRFTSSSSETIQQDSSSSSLEQSCTHHLIQDQPQSAATINLNTFYNYYSGSIVGTSRYCSTLINNNNPPADWLSSCNGFLPGEWDSEHFVTQYNNYGIVPTTVSLTGDIYEQNPTSLFMSSTTNILHFQSQNQGK